MEKEDRKARSMESKKIWQSKHLERQTVSMTNIMKSLAISSQEVLEDMDWSHEEHEEHMDLDSLKESLGLAGERQNWQMVDEEAEHRVLDDLLLILGDRSTGVQEDVEMESGERAEMSVDDVMTGSGGHWRDIETFTDTDQDKEDMDDGPEEVGSQEYRSMY
jgi:hypothetical protein